MAQMLNYTISQFAELLEKKGLLAEVCFCGREEESVSGLTYNSKAVEKNTMFICKGVTFKKEYLEEAVKRGSCCYVSDRKYELDEEVPHLIVSDIREAMPILADFFYHHAWEEFRLIGIGGTKGKSTTVYYMKAILDDYQEAKGRKACGVISSIDVYDGVIEKDSHITTPEAVELHQHFRNAADSQMDYMAMEISSQALKYGRVAEVKFDVGVFLNISEDHISPIEHPDFEDYLQSKLRMFAQTKTAVVNMDADYSERILDAAKASEKIITFSTKDERADFYAYNIRKEGHAIIFGVRCVDFDEEFKITMPGLFNVENALAAIASAWDLQIPKEYIHTGLERARTRGRMEIYASKDNQIIAIVDYAHNKLSFEKLFESTKEEYPDYERVCVFGCPGKKAFIRRKYLGTIAGQNADRIILTSDEPGLEPVEEICADIAQYIDESCPYETIIDRTEAIKKAIETAKGKTVILIAGKGHERSMKIGNQYVDYPSDAVNAVRFLQEYDKQHE